MFQPFDNNLVETKKQTNKISKKFIKYIFTSSFILYNCQSVAPVKYLKLSSKLKNEKKKIIL
jgi:hypothetical protein